MEIVENICSNGHGNINPCLLVVHSTADPGADARTLVRFWQSGQTQYQAHYCVDWKGNCFHCIDDSKKAWHCGNANGVSIGIEICEPANDSDLQGSWKYAIEAVRLILKKHGWDSSFVVSHKWVSETYGGSDHTDPYPFFDRIGRTWDDFINGLNAGSKNLEEVFKMHAFLYFATKTENYPKDAWVLWDRQLGFKYLNDPGQVNFIKAVDPNIQTITCADYAPFDYIAYQLTDENAKKTYGAEFK